MKFNDISMIQKTLSDLEYKLVDNLKLLKSRYTLETVAKKKRWKEIIDTKQYFPTTYHKKFHSSR